MHLMQSAAWYHLAEMELERLVAAKEPAPPSPSLPPPPRAALTTSNSSHALGESSDAVVPAMAPTPSLAVLGHRPRARPNENFSLAASLGGKVKPKRKVRAEPGGAPLCTPQTAPSSRAQLTGARSKEQLQFTLPHTTFAGVPDQHFPGLPNPSLRASVPFPSAHRGKLQSVELLAPSCRKQPERDEPVHSALPSVKPSPLVAVARRAPPSERRAPSPARRRPPSPSSQPRRPASPRFVRGGDSAKDWPRGSRPTPNGFPGKRIGSPARRMERWLSSPSASPRAAVLDGPSRDPNKVTSAPPLVRGRRQRVKNAGTRWEIHPLLPDPSIGSCDID
ncbi:hypothetical protein AB1Y20_009705 [Prymnesium parvum]|uniref:Uncharacterized protein n=1 Tax=Prymnesium parvum TaxID=97485 RepID=A0AB34K290_PRYPA